MRSAALFLVFATLLALGGATAGAREAAPATADPALEARTLELTSELRCLVCQNQTIADSHADLAVDLRDQVREKLRHGETKEQILDYMTARYGDFVLYRPPVKGSTWLLWFGPLVLLLGGLAGLALVLRRRSRLGPDQFEPDEEEVPLPPAHSS